MSKPILSNVFAAGFTGDPRIAPGCPDGGIGSLLPRKGTTELYQRTGALATDWALFGGALGAYQTVAFAGTNQTPSLVYVSLPNTQIAVAVAGTYLCFFNAILHGNNPNNLVYYVFAVNGVVVPNCERHGQGNSDKAAVLIQPIVLAAGDALEVQWHVDGGTGEIHDRNVVILKIA